MIKIRKFDVDILLESGSRPVTEPRTLRAMTILIS